MNEYISFRRPLFTRNLWCFALLCLLGLAACRSKKSGGSAKAKRAAMMKRFSWRKKKQIRPVHAAVVKRGNIDALLSGTTTLTAEAKVTIIARVNGLVTRLYAKEGKRFRRGATLAYLSNPYLKLAVDKAKLEVQKLTNDLKRQQRLLRKGLVSKETEESLRFQLAQAKNQLARASQDYRHLRISATIDGIVTARMLTKGAWVTPNTQAFMQENPRSLVANIAVPEKYLPRLKLGLRAQLQAEALGRRTKLTGQVVRIAPTIDTKSGTLTVVIGKLTPLTRLRSGMFVTADLILDQQHNVPLIPKQAVQYSRNRPYVYRLVGTPKQCSPGTTPSAGRGRRGRFRNMTPEQRAKIRARFRNMTPEQRAKIRARRRGKRGGWAKGKAGSGCKVERVFFTKGLEDTHTIQAKSGIREGDRVVILGQEGLQNNSQVKVSKLILSSTPSS